MSQNHFTLSFPLKSPADAKALAEQLPPLMPAFFEAADKIGTIHYSRFTVLEREDAAISRRLRRRIRRAHGRSCARSSGPVFDLIFQHVDQPPPTPVAEHVASICRMGRGASASGGESLHRVPGRDAPKRSKRWRSSAGVEGAGELHPFLVILPTKSRIAFFETQLLLRARGRGITKDLDTVGTPHFAQFIPLKTTRSASLRSMTATLTITLPISPRISVRSSIFYSNSPRARRPRPAENTCRSSSTLRRAQIVLPSGSIRRIRACRYRTSMPSSPTARRSRASR